MLRLDKPGGEWQVDLETATGTMKLETLKELEFRTGTGEGQTTKVLLAADYTLNIPPNPGHEYNVNIYVRDNLTGKWNMTVIAHVRPNLARPLASPPAPDTPVSRARPRMSRATASRCVRSACTATASPTPSACSFSSGPSAFSRASSTLPSMA